MASLDLQYIADLVLDAQEGDSNAFAELFAATYQKQYAFALRCLHEDFPAQQALQSAYIQALSGISNLRDPALFVVWLNQLTLRACLLSEQNTAFSTDEHHMLDLDGKAYSVRQVLTLPFSEAQALLLHALCGMRIGEIASLLEIRRGDVRRHMASGRKRLAMLSIGEGGARR